MRLLSVLMLAGLIAGIPVGAHATDLTVTVKNDNRLQQPNGSRRPVTPIVVIPQPIYFSAPQRCILPGYWAYTWVPQSYSETVWVPSYYNYDAVWVEGHYESRSYDGGYYQPYWVPERVC